MLYTSLASLSLLAVRFASNTIERYLSLQYSAVPNCSTLRSNNNSLALTWSSGDNIVNRNEANVVQSPPNTLSLDEWQFVVLRKQGTLVDIFVDSEHVHQGQLASADIGFPLTADKRIRLAKPMVHETMYNRAFVGSVDNFAIWQRALTEQEIVDMYYNQASAGRHELTIKATDKAGNVGTSTVDFNMAQCH